MQVTHWGIQNREQIHKSRKEGAWKQRLYGTGICFEETKGFSVLQKDFKKSNSRKSQGRKHINDINILTLVVCLKSPKSALLSSIFFQECEMRSNLFFICLRTASLHPIKQAWGNTWKWLRIANSERERERERQQAQTVQFGPSSLSQGLCVLHSTEDSFSTLQSRHYFYSHSNLQLVRAKIRYSWACVREDCIFWFYHLDTST